MNLKDFYDYKNQFFEDVLTNEKLVKLINENKTLETAGELAYTQLFPYKFIPETIEHGHTYICCDVDVEASSTNSRARSGSSTRLFYRPIIYIWILVHKSKLRLPEGGVRYDVIASEIADTINESLYYGINGLQLYSAKWFSPLTDYQGKVLSFTTDDYNWQFDYNRSIPSNRKAGF